MVEQIYTLIDYILQMLINNSNK